MTGRPARTTTPAFRRPRFLQDNHVVAPSGSKSTAGGTDTGRIFNRAVDFPSRPSIFNHMVELQTPQMNSVFHALGDATRRHMLRDLTGGERTVSQLAQPFAISLAAASKHIKVLENAGMIRREVRGRTHLCRLDPGPLASAHQWLRFYKRFWTDRLEECGYGLA